MQHMGRVQLMFVLGDYSREEQKGYISARKNKTKFFRILWLKTGAKEHANQKHLIKTKLLNKLEEKTKIKGTKCENGYFLPLEFL